MIFPPVSVVGLQSKMNVFYERLSFCKLGARADPWKTYNNNAHVKCNVKWHFNDSFSAAMLQIHPLADTNKKVIWRKMIYTKKT